MESYDTEVTMNRKRILDIPTIEQLPKHCGPASLSMILAYWNQPITQEDLAELLGGKEHIIENGAQGKRIVELAENLGYHVTKHYITDFEKITETINRGVPILAQLPHHFCVIRGYESEPKLLWVNDPARTKNNPRPYTEFQTQWARPSLKYRTKYTGIVIEPRHLKQNL